MITEWQFKKDGGRLSIRMRSDKTPNVSFGVRRMASEAPGKDVIEFAPYDGVERGDIGRRKGQNFIELRVTATVLSGDAPIFAEIWQGGKRLKSAKGNYEEEVLKAKPLKQGKPVSRALIDLFGDLQDE